MKNIKKLLTDKLKKQGYFETADYYYNKFKKQGLTDEEIADSFVLPMKLTPKQKEKESQFFKNRIQNMSEEQTERKLKALRKYIEEESSKFTKEQKEHFKKLGEKFKQEDLKNLKK